MYKSQAYLCVPFASLFLKKSPLLLSVFPTFPPLCIVITLDYFGYNGRRPSTGSSIYHSHHRRHSSDETTPRKHRRRPSSQSKARYSYVLPPSPLSTTFEEVGTPLLSPSSAVSPMSPPLATPPVPLAIAADTCPEELFSRRTTQRHERINVLLVDDNHVNLQVLSRVLKVHMSDTVQHVELVKSGLKALELLNTHTYDLLLLDIDMPILSGVDTARHIRNSKEYDILLQNRNIPIVAVTTNDTADWKRAFAQVGMNGCVSKPVVVTALKRTIHQVLSSGCSPESLAAS